jgi:hypothetical protein
MDSIHKRQADISPQPPWLIVFAKSEGENHKAPVNMSKARFGKLLNKAIYDEQTQ